MKLKFKALGPDATLPTRGTPGSAGYDLYVTNDVLVPCNDCIKAHTQIAVELPEGTVGLIFPRSGLATKMGVRLANCVAVIDSDYRGELMIPLYSDSGAVSINKGERVAQLVIVPCFTPEPEFVDELSDTIRNNGGFGSTGK